MSDYSSSRISRRKALSTMAKAAIAGGVVVVAGVGGFAAYNYLSKPSGKQVGDTLKIGYSTSLSGYQAPGAVSQQNAYALWKDTVNNAGGINLSKLGRKVPIEFVQYDDQSDPTTMLTNYDKLVNSDKCDLLLAPYGTPNHFALGAALNNYNIPVVGNTSIPDASQISSGHIKYLYWPSAGTQAYMDAAIAFMQKESSSIKNVAIINVQSDFPVAANQYLSSKLPSAGFNIVLNKDYPANVTDLTSLLTQVKSANPDAIFALCYPADAFLLTHQAISLGVNASFFYELIGPTIAAFHQAYGSALNGLTSMSMWTSQMTYSGSQDFYNAFQAKFKTAPDYLDAGLCWVSSQILQSAVEQVGTIDYSAINNVIATSTFQTIMGSVKFTNQANSISPALLVQWQSHSNGPDTFEEIYPQQTASPVFPKPPWPAASTTSSST